MELVGQQELLETAVRDLLASCDNDEDTSTILQRLATLKAKLANIRNTVECKAAAHDVFIERSQMLAAARHTIANIRERLKDAVTAEELSHLQCDLDRTRSDLMSFEACHPQMEELFHEAGITVHSRDKERAADVKDDVKQLLSDVENEEKKLKLCLQVIDLNILLSGVCNDLNEIGLVYLDDVDNLRMAVEVSHLLVLYFCVFFLVC